MIADWELIGVPYRVVIGERGLRDSQVEFQGRSESAAQVIPLKSIAQKIITAINTAKNNLI